MKDARQENGDEAQTSDSGELAERTALLYSAFEIPFEIDTQSSEAAADTAPPSGESFDIAQKRHIFLQSMPLRNLVKGELLPNDCAANNVCSVNTGILKAYRISADGSERLTAFYTDDAVFPAGLAYAGVKNVFTWYKCVSRQASVSVIPEVEYRKFIASEPDLLLKDMECLAKNHVQTEILADALQYGKAPDKILHALYYLSSVKGTTIKDVTQIEINFSHQDIANLVGLARETVTIELNKLRADGAIAFGRGSKYRLHKKFMELLEDS